MKPFRRYLAGACIGLLAAPLIITSAQAEPVPAAAADPTAAATEQSVVTLITGDRVHVTTYPDEAVAIDIDPAERATGVEPVFSKQEYDGHTYVIPSDVAALVGEMLDPALFDVRGLVDAGYDDASVDDIPVIVDYGVTVPSARSRSTALPAMEVERTLASIGAVSADLDKDGIAAFRDALIAQSATSSRARAAAPAIEKIWLDARVEVQLEDSVPQIGAHQMWDAGFTGEGIRVAVLDSGVDATHPDLAGKIVLEENFSNAADVVDRHGHGTHVASTVAGTGAASDGLRKGVAPDAELISGKVLNDLGSGAISEIIAGMEWAVANDADIVSMSVGSNGVWTDGSDPAAQAVNALSAESGVLFVIAAGNNGSAAGTISTPGSADAALTVGAVNDADVVANFSGRGPRAGDYQLKPDVTAPGVGIIAARAAGTSRGTLHGQYYTAVSGTSMATPHVAGAAALLLQQNPDLTGQELKGLLSSTALRGAGTIWDQGTGRIDLTYASKTTVLADSGSLSLGFFDYPQTDVAPVTRSITYTNIGEEDVTLAIAMDVVDEQGVAPAPGMLTLHQSAVTVPAGGSSTVDVTVDPQQGEPGVYAGYLTAEAESGDVLRAGVGFAKEAERYDLVITAIDRNGDPAGGQSSVDVVNVDDRAIFAKPGVAYVDGVATLRVPAGNYSVGGVTFTPDEGGKYAVEETTVMVPEVYVGDDVAIELDARDAVEIDVATPEESAVSGTILAYQRKDAKGSSFTHTWSMTAPIDRHSVLPTETVQTGSFEWYTSQTLRAPEITASVGDELELTLRYARLSERLDGDITASFVDAGSGTPAELAAAGVEGRVALVERTGNTFNQQVTDATAAGASAIVIYNSEPGLIMTNGITGKIPHMTLSQAEGHAIQELMTDGVVEVSIVARKSTPYLYETMFPFEGGIPSELDLRVTAENAATVTANYRAQVAGVGIAETRHRWRPWEPSAFGLLRIDETPSVRTEMITTDPDTMWGHNYYINATPANPFGAYMSDTRRPYLAGTRLEENFQTQVTAPGFALYGPTSATRTGNKVALAIPEWVDSDGHWGEWFYQSDSSSFRLFENGVQKAASSRAKGTFTVGSEPAEYRLELDVARTAEWWTMSTATSTVWTVHSAPEGVAAEVLPLLRADLEPDVDLHNRASRAAHHIDIEIQHQPGAVASAIVETAVWVSTDDGANWREVKVSKHGKDGLRAVVTRLPKDAEFVSLRIEATDAAGNRIEQEITRAYGLR
ncbi:S8 family serine peptidase [Microbacterium hominis]|uniref:S8 family serine peptidase n=1 Tax=Microbacterium hominis TaxID=162426 RepID=A0A7D4PT49_9MICO|nr:S8 family serine peptidase [Microbacterium hominis]QKJ18314.1 S8 family serine peptidase [Microbacterium hominis]